MANICYLVLNEKTRQRAHDEIDVSSDGDVMVIKEATRTLEQNSLQWVYLSAISKQVEWVVNGRPTLMAPDEWKDVLTAGFRKETPRLAAAVDGMGVVMLGSRTSRFSKAEFSEWMEYLQWFCAEKDVEV
jgi:hypothetical protein